LEDFVSLPDQFATSRRPAQGVDRRTVIGGAGAIGVGFIGAATLAVWRGAATPQTRQEEFVRTDRLGRLVVKAADIPVGGGTVFATAKVVVTQAKAGEF
jgi:hypothetical protein